MPRRKAIATLTKARCSDARVLFGPYNDADRHGAIVQFPGGYVAEIHDLRSRARQVR